MCNITTCQINLSQASKLTFILYLWTVKEGEIAHMMKVVEGFAYQITNSHYERIIIVQRLLIQFNF